MKIFDRNPNISDDDFHELSMIKQMWWVLTHDITHGMYDDIKGEELVWFSLIDLKVDLSKDENFDDIVWYKRPIIKVAMWGLAIFIYSTLGVLRYKTRKFKKKYPEYFL